MTWIKAQREIHLSLMMMMMKREEEETSSSFSLSSYNLQRYKLVEIERQVKRLWNIENRTVWIFSSSQMSLMDDVRERVSRKTRNAFHLIPFNQLLVKQNQPFNDGDELSSLFILSENWSSPNGEGENIESIWRMWRAEMNRLRFSSSCLPTLLMKAL